MKLCPSIFLVLANNYNPNNHPLDNERRSRPFANPSNGIQLIHVESVFWSGYDFVPRFSWAVQSGGTSVQLTPVSGHNLPIRYYKWVIKDGEGNEAFGALDLDNPSAAVTISTSALNPNHAWEIIFSAAINVPHYSESDSRIEYSVSTISIASSDPSATVSFGSEAKVKRSYVLAMPQAEGGDTLKTQDNDDAGTQTAIATAALSLGTEGDLPQIAGEISRAFETTYGLVKYSVTAHAAYNEANDTVFIVVHGLPENGTPQIIDGSPEVTTDLVRI